MGAKTSKSRSRPFGRSDSAPTLGSHKRKPAEAVRPRAAKSVDSLPECPAALGREELPLTLLDLSDRAPFTHVDASLAGTEPPRSPGSPSLDTRAEPVPPGPPKPPCAQGRGGGPGLEPPLEEGEGSGLPCGRVQAGDVAALPPSSHLELSRTGPKPPEGLGMEQSPDEQPKTTRTRDRLSTAGAPPSPAEGGPALEYFRPEGSGATDRRGECPCGGPQRPESAPHDRPGNETLMEVEAADQALVAAGSRLKEQNVRLPAVSAECSVMEAEPSKPGPSLPTEPLSASESGRRASESTDTSAAVGFSGGPPPPPPPPSAGPLSRQVEEACPSLASALKELHQLLVASYRTASQRESLDPPGGALPEEETAGEELSGGERPDCGARSARDGGLSPPAGGPECAPGAASAGVPFPGPGAEDGQESLQLPEQSALRIEEPLDSDLNSSVALGPSVASCDPPGGERSGALPRSPSSDRPAGRAAFGQNQPPSGPAQGSGSRSALHSSRGEPGRPASAGPDAPGAPHARSPGRAPAAPRPPSPASVAVERVVRAGFTPQEAREALERAGGDVDLALLILLAQKIVVPP